MKFRLSRYEYTTIPKSYLKDKALSLKAKGLLTIMFSLPEEWNYNIKGLEKLTCAGETQIKNILKELKIAGYLKIEKTKNDLGRFEYIYDISHIPYPTEYRQIESENP